MAQVIMNALDAVAGSQASCYINLPDQGLYNFMQLYAFEASMEINNVEVPILGLTGKGHKPAGWTGTWKGTAHYNQSLFRWALQVYKRTGEVRPFTIQVRNEDKTTAAGAQTIILKNCLIKSAILAKFDANSELLDEEIEGTFDDWEITESFELLPGMQVGK